MYVSYIWSLDLKKNTSFYQLCLALLEMHFKIKWPEDITSGKALAGKRPQ